MGGWRGLLGGWTAGASRPPCTDSSTACSASAARRSASRARSSACATLSCISLQAPLARSASSDFSCARRSASAARRSAALVRSSICRRRSCASRQRPLLRLALLLQALLGRLQAGARALCGRDVRPWAAGGSMPGSAGRLGLRPALVGLALHPLRLLDPPVGLGPDPLLLPLDLRHLVVDPLFGARPAS